ncbi:very short patch repair endonuclease [Nocardia sp. bgisy118]|uniref:very short patch repair endonuclease n=1 Tax=Nocardia sp. bgisy118 TaxID=3413786 RepID=UPI003F4A39FC
MRANRRRDTAPELALRRRLYSRGLRYRVDVRPLAQLGRTADIVFAADRVAVFVDGCFWHGCPLHHRPATKNSAFWVQKIQSNQSRDRDTSSKLIDAGWTVIRVWEHEDPTDAAARIEGTIRRLRDSRAPTARCCRARGECTCRRGILVFDLHRFSVPIVFRCGGFRGCRGW